MVIFGILAHFQSPSNPSNNITRNLVIQCLMVYLGESIDQLIKEYSVSVEVETLFCFCYSYVFVKFQIIWGIIMFYLSFSYRMCPGNISCVQLQSENPCVCCFRMLMRMVCHKIFLNRGWKSTKSRLLDLRRMTLALCWRVWELCLLWAIFQEHAQCWLDWHMQSILPIPKS